LNRSQIDRKMKIVADLHLHSPFSRAVSRDMTIKNIERGAIVKGLQVVGTGDFTHPLWRKELASLVEEDGLYRTREVGTVRFLISGEVCTSFLVKGKTRRIHHLILLPSLEAADAISAIIGKRGRLDSDGRPYLSMTGAELAESVTDLGEDAMIIPAHIWTPWFSLFGDRGGVDTLVECYEDMAPHIYALETGLSSDPPMNWRVSALDRYTLISNSDSHSPSPWRIGREANILEAPRLTYREIVDTIMHHKERVATIEVDPSYGKYHWTGHRDCNISVPPGEAARLKGVCPICGKKMTKGVAERVEELADRAEGVVPPGAQSYVKVLPLSEIVAVVMRKDVFSAEVQKRYWGIVSKFSGEMEALTSAPLDALIEACGEEIAEVIIRSRQGKLVIEPGYDGVYGKPVVAAVEPRRGEAKPPQRGERFLRKGRNLDDYTPKG
jgi:uncharacterized protein (TIGR00375 family)